MQEKEALEILGAAQDIDEGTLKRLFRQKMKEHHPDTLNSDDTDYAMAQKINQAYEVLKNRKVVKNKYNKKAATRNNTRNAYNQIKKENKNAYEKRNIYIRHLLDAGQKINYEKIAEGKYFWEPEFEDFSLFLLSVNHLSVELLNGQKNQYSCQMKIFHMLANQFIRPLYSLRKLLNPIETDGEGRQIFLIDAVLGAGGNKSRCSLIEKLDIDAYILPEKFADNRLFVTDIYGNMLGHLSFAEDALYYVLFPILKLQKAQIKMTVKSIHKSKRKTSFDAYANIKMWIRIDGNESEVELDNETVNRRIRELIEGV